MIRIKCVYPTHYTIWEHDRTPSRDTDFVVVKNLSIMVRKYGGVHEATVRLTLAEENLLPLLGFKKIQTGTTETSRGKDCDELKKL